jgi:hypothetical protein
MSKASAEKIYNTVKGVYLDLYGGEITESKNVTLSLKVYNSIVKSSEKYGVSPQYIVKVMGFRVQDLINLEEKMTI